MRNLFFRLVALVVVCLLVLETMFPGMAFAAEIEIGKSLSSTLKDLVETAVATIIAGVVSFVALKMKEKWNIDIGAQHRDALTAFLQRQASGLVAQGAVRLEGVKINVENTALANAANAALGAIPQAMDYFGLTPQRVEQMIVDMLPKQPAVATAAAVAIDANNPATPSTPAS